MALSAGLGGLAAPAAAMNVSADPTDPRIYYASPEWVRNPDAYWDPWRTCVNFTEAFDPMWDPLPAGHPNPQGKGEITFHCASEGATITAWIKGRPYPMEYGDYRTYFHGGTSHWIDYDCLAVGTPVFFEGTDRFAVTFGGPGLGEDTIPEQTVEVTEKISRWDNADELFRYKDLPARCGNPSVFTDIGTGHAFYKPIQWAAANGIATGGKDGKIRQTQTVTREEMAVSLARWGKIPTTNKINGEQNFNIDWRRWEPSIRPGFHDVPAARQYSVEISLLSQIGVINGRADGTFRPAEKVTRGQASAFLYRLAGSPAHTPPKTSAFKDSRPGTSFSQEISWMAANGFTTGYADKTFRPHATITRGEMLVMLHRFEKVYSGANRGNGIVE